MVERVRIDTEAPVFFLANWYSLWIDALAISSGSNVIHFGGHIHREYVLMKVRETIKVAFVNQDGLLLLYFTHEPEDRVRSGGPLQRILLLLIVLKLTKFARVKIVAPGRLQRLVKASIDRYDADPFILRCRH